MAQAYGDDLRRKFLSAYDQGEETLEELAGRFLVSLGWAKKISAQRNRTGQAERMPHQPGRKPHADVEAQRKVMDWMAQAGSDVVEIQVKLCSEAGSDAESAADLALVAEIGSAAEKKSLHASERDTEANRKRAKSSSRTSERSRRSG